jgi:hypothetical protein
MVPLGSFLRWLSSTAGYVPGNEARISSSDIAHHQRVLSSGCYPFLSGRLENLAVFLASLSASTKGVIASANRSAFTLSQHSFLVCSHTERLNQAGFCPLALREISLLTEPALVHLRSY